MTINEFLRQLTELLDIDDELTSDSNLKQYDEFDSMAIMSLVAFIHKNFGKQFSARQLNQIETVNSLIELIGKDNFIE
ncbi:MAG TPA: acyl carrier protein [Bacteroidales bacterium]|mgnify:CR=1 FL=1|nr:acyl carrier protein [Bacteroidales bacterium]